MTAAATARERQLARLRRWLEYIAQTAIDLLDDLDEEGFELEDDDREADA